MGITEEMGISVGFRRDSGAWDTVSRSRLSQKPLQRGDVVLGCRNLRNAASLKK
jgi:hypothetical protein